ncbi:chloride channel CLIC-like protein 1 isoform X2 [Centropristis striata]|uniref:chloride channel CLIC-like protein 1 isoform X2 n=1 Tax=Centropristis striata TaxID=184440 RepID=UPI0027DFE6CE|nr:chloride channel CLIC-like protein 1 isoform X2 [Centropristis striata]
MYPPLSARMLLIVLVCSLSLAATGQEEDNDWIDPYDMLNYDASTKTMRKPTEPATQHYDKVPTKRREYQDPNQVEQTSCSMQVADQQRQIEELKKKITATLQQPSCNPVFKRFLTRLLKEIQRAGLPSDSTDVFYDAKIKLSTQSMTEIQALLEGEDSWRTGALDTAISQILVDLRPHDYEAWKWRFEDSFGVELDTVFKIGLCVLVLVAIICTELWSTVSWFVQFWRLFAISFFISFIWNWLYLYKTAFADHQRNLAKIDDYEKCTGMKKIDWSDSLKEWYRSTWTLQDDPCKKYYEILLVNPILLVPPTKAIAVTFTTFITEPLKHIGQGISEFLVALLKDLPFTLQLPVLLTIVLAIVVCMYGSVHAAFRYGIAAPFQRPQRDPPPPQLEQPQPRLQQIEDRDHLAGGDAPQQAPRHRDNDARLQRNQVHQRRHNRPRQEPAVVVVETLRNAEPRSYSEDEMDSQQREAEQRLSSESDSENQQEVQEQQAGENASSVAANTTPKKTKPTDSKLSPSKSKPVEVNKKLSQDKLRKDGAAPISPHAGRPPSQTDVQDLQASGEDMTAAVSRPPVETVGVPVQETSVE